MEYEFEISCLHLGGWRVGCAGLVLDSTLRVRFQTPVLLVGDFQFCEEAAENMVDVDRIG